MSAAWAEQFPEETYLGPLEVFTVQQSALATAGILASVEESIDAVLRGEPQMQGLVELLDFHAHLSAGLPGC